MAIVAVTAMPHARPFPKNETIVISCKSNDSRTILWECLFGNGDETLDCGIRSTELYKINERSASLPD